MCENISIGKVLRPLFTKLAITVQPNMVFKQDLKEKLDININISFESSSFTIMTTTFDLISLFDYVLTLSIVKTKKKKKKKNSKN